MAAPDAPMDPKANPWSTEASTAASEAEKPQVQNWLECAQCRFPLVKSEELIEDRCQVRTDVAWCYELEVFDRQVWCYSATNAHDHRFDVVRVQSTALTRSMVQEGNATAEFSWFPGFAWSMAHCANCFCHIGWAFQPEPDRASDATTATAEDVDTSDFNHPFSTQQRSVAFFGLVLTKMREQQRLEEEVAHLFQTRPVRRAATVAPSAESRREISGLMATLYSLQRQFRHLTLEEAILMTSDDTQQALERHGSDVRNSTSRIIVEPNRLLQRLRNGLRRAHQRMTAASNAQEPRLPEEESTTNL